jgi:hypothetical protein
MSRSRLVVVSSLAVVITGVLAALGALVLEPARAAVGPLPPEGLALPGDARFVMGLDVKRVTDSPFYKRYAHTGGRPEAFGDLEARTGLNPERDVDQVFIAGREAGPGASVALVLGRFDRSKLSQAIESHTGDVTWKSVQGTNVYLFREGTKGSGALAFLDDHALVMGSSAGVESALASQAQGTAGLKGNPALLGLVEQVKPGSAFWMVGDQSLLANLPKTVPGAGGGSLTLPNLKSLIVTGDLDPAVALAITGEATDEAAAKNLADIVRGFVGFMALQASSKPELKDLGSAISVATDQNKVLVSARLSYELLDALQPKKAVSAP